jgi:hypothetical protein
VRSATSGKWFTVGFQIGRKISLGPEWQSAYVIYGPVLTSSLAEGLAVESFQRDNLDAFDNADEYVHLYGSAGEPLVPFAPIVRYRSNLQELGSHIRRTTPLTCGFLGG